jgi:hypothetical protein
MRLLAVSLVCGVLVCAAAAAAGDPMLRAVAPSQRHLIVTFAPGALTPAEVEAATLRSRSATGAFLPSHIRLRERITQHPNAAGVVRYRTVKALAPGTYFVAVSAIAEDPPADCLRIKSACAERWSNVLRVVVD